MIFITPTSNAAHGKAYFKSGLSRADYYVKDAAEQPGQWHGLGAKLLNLEGTVRQQDFDALCDNIDPNTGKNLTRITQANRRVFYDFTFDAPKSVSLAYAVGRDERIADAFQSSATEILNEMEAAMQVRVRAKGADEDRYSSNVIRADFLHRTTRPVDGIPDMHMHQHSVFLNQSFDSIEGKWKAGQFGQIVAEKFLYQAKFS